MRIAGVASLDEVVSQTLLLARNGDSLWDAGMV